MRELSPTGFGSANGLPLLGSLIPISRDALRFFTGLLETKGDRVQLRVPGRRVLLLCHPDDIEQVLVRDRDAYGRSTELRKLRPIFGEGLLSSEGELWRRQRTMIQPSFQHQALAKYADIMLATISERVDGWRDGEDRAMHPEMMRYTRETICHVLFGEQFIAQQAELGEAVTTVFGELRSEVLYLPLWRRLPFGRSRRWNRAVEVLNRTIRATIAARRASGLEQDDLLGALLRARDAQGEAMSDQQIHDEILTLFLGGHETAAVGLTWALYLLAKHPEAQERLCQEIAEVTGGAELRAEDYPKLRWTNAVAKEAMRLYPPIWSMGREVTADTELGGQPLPKNTDIWICVHRLHRDPRWYDEPDRFLPERWMRDGTQKPFTYLPFGIGPRVCIGQHFAAAETVLGLAKIVSRFRLELSGAQTVEPSAWITLRPKEPVLMRLHGRP